MPLPVFLFPRLRSCPHEVAARRLVCLYRFPIRSYCRCCRRQSPTNEDNNKNASAPCSTPQLHPQESSCTRLTLPTLTLTPASSQKSLTTPKFEDALKREACPARTASFARRSSMRAVLLPRRVRHKHRIRAIYEKLCNVLFDFRNQSLCDETRHRSGQWTTTIVPRRWRAHESPSTRLETSVSW